MSRGYYPSGKLRFESMLLNGEKHGIQKAYDFLGRITFEGEIINGYIVKK